MKNIILLSLLILTLNSCSDPKSELLINLGAKGLNLKNLLVLGALSHIDLESVEL